MLVASLLNVESRMLDSWALELRHTIAQASQSYRYSGQQAGKPVMAALVPFFGLLCSMRQLRLHNPPKFKGNLYTVKSGLPSNSQLETALLVEASELHNLNYRTYHYTATASNESAVIRVVVQARSRLVARLTLTVKFGCDDVVARYFFVDL